MRHLKDGKVSPASRALGDGAPERFAVACAMVDGNVVSAGDDTRQFAIQSISKPFLYGLALDVLSRETVHRKVSVEPTTESFNSLTELESDRLPYNPMMRLYDHQCTVTADTRELALMALRAWSSECGLGVFSDSAPSREAQAVKLDEGDGKP